MNLRPETLAHLRIAARHRPAAAALLELTLQYQATPTQIAGMTVGDVTRETLRFPTKPGRKVAVRAIPAVQPHLAPFTADRAPDELLFGATVEDVRDELDALFAVVGERYVPPRGAEHVLYLSQTALGPLAVVRDPAGLYAVADGTLLSMVHANGDPPGSVTLWSHLDAHVPPAPRLLLLGGGAMVGAAWLESRYAPAVLDVVEHDDRWLGLARTFFGYEPAVETTVIGLDAEAWLAEATDPYDAIVYDLADARGGRPPLARAGFAERCAALAPVLLANLWTTLDSELLAELGATLDAAGYTERRVVPLRTHVDLEQVQTVCVIARRA